MTESLVGRAMSWDTLMNADFGEETWRVEGLWPKGTAVLLLAARKTGKSTTVSNLLRTLVDGEPLFDHYAGVPVDDGRTVVIIDLELSPRQIQAWGRGLNLQRPDHVVYLPLRGHARLLDLFTEEGMRQLIEDLKQLRAQVVILDPLRPLVDAHGLNEWTDLSRIYEAMKEVTAEAGVDEFLLVHHAGNAAFGADAEGIRARGDSGLEGGVDVIWRMSPIKDGEGRKFVAFGREVDSTATITYSKDTGLYTANSVQGEAVALGDATLDILRELIARYGSVRQGDLLEAVYGTRDHTSKAGSALRRWINKMIVAGHVRKEIDGSLVVSTSPTL